MTATGKPGEDCDPAASWPARTSPEWKLMLASVRRMTGRSVLADTDCPPSEGVDGGRLTRLASWHAVLPLVRESIDAWPSATDGFPLLEQACRTEDDRSRRLTDEMLGTCDLFRREDIQAVPFKGPVLAVQAYGNERLRHFSDIDFLVRPEDMRRARQCLMAQGYQWLNPVRPAGEDGYIRSGWPCMLEHDQRQCQIDLDTGVAPAYFAFAVPSAILWDRLETIVIGGQTVRTVTAQLAILLLCVHACKHQWRLLGYAADVAGLAARRSKDIEWPALVELARRLGGERMLLLGLALASDLGGVSLPDAVMRRIAADRPLGPVRAAAVQSMEREPGPRPGWVAEMRFHMKCRERYRDRVTYALRLVLTPGFSDWNAIGLPRGLRGFYRLAHVWRLVLKAFTPQQWERFRR